MCDKNTQDASAAQWNRAAAAAPVPSSTKIIQNMPDLVTNANAAAEPPHLYMDNIYEASGAAAVPRYTSLVQHSTIDSSGKLSSGFVAPFPAAISPVLEMSTHPYAVDMLKKVKTHQMEYVKKLNSTLDEQQHATSSSSTIITSKLADKNIDSLEADNIDKPHNSYGLITNTLAENVLNAIGAPPSAQVQSSVAPIHGRIFSMGVAKDFDLKKLQGVQQLVESGVSDYAKQNITKLLESIAALRPLEKLLLYLRLPSDSPDLDPLRQPQNPLGTRSEINHTINWVRTHLEHDPQVSIPKQDVYDDYIIYCERLQLKPLSTADFGKVMKQVFPGIRPRRLGTRGHSRYCYAAMRKTATLVQPQLPNLAENTKPLYKTEELEKQKELRDSKPLSEDFDTWQIIQSWSEQILNVRVKNVQELAAIIKTQPQHDKKLNTGGALLQCSSKDKQLINDTGPLKKRRKKKRKGSSSSESSTATATATTTTTPRNCEDMFKLKEELESPTPATTTSLMQMNMLNIKQEVADVPTQAQINFSPTQQQQQQQQQHFQLQYQQTPMNLAADKHAYKQTTTTRTATVPVLQNVPIQSSTNANVIVSRIKEEITEESHTPTIYCKKVLKAHQTKGFWVNTTTNATASTLLPLTGNKLLNKTTTTTTTNAHLNIMNINTSSVSPTTLDVQQATFPMGPPAHMANSVSTSPLAVLSDHSGQTGGSNFSNNMAPRVASRNILLLRAKRQMAMAKAAAAVAAMSATNNATPTTIANSVVEEATELPENLGLPRERVISICNMDKHELDDYFLPEQEEEESQEEQDTELLQYFQTGDAEEKLNDSLDANKKNPTAVLAQQQVETTINIINEPTIATTTTTTTATAATTTITTTTTTTTNNVNTIIANKILLSQEQQQDANIKTIATESTTKTTATTLFKTTVGSASASLALLSRKHQMKQQQIKSITSIDKNENNNMYNNNVDNCFVNGRNKNRIFVPISPNSATPQHHQQKQIDVFASPKLNSRLLFKQQSLNTDDSSDPMIGASRRKRTFTSMTTSASAPPSPSILQQQQQQEQKRRQFNQAVDWMHNQNEETSLLNQNSLDFDLFEVNNELQVQQLDQNITNSLFDLEAQRSQSVPLTQQQQQLQQRILSPLTKKVNSYYEQQQQELATVAPPPDDIVPTTSSSLLDVVDYSVMLNSPEFMSKFDCLTQSAKTSVPSTTYCSSSTSSSGYSSSAYSCNVSRSVPSTPLPLQLNLFDSYNSQRKLQNSPITGVIESESFQFGQATNSITAAMHTDDMKNAGLLNYTNDFSKSMPTTPINTHCFRYSPSEFSRDLLINGNTLDSFNQIANSDVTMSIANKNSNNYLVDPLKDDDSVNLDSLCNDSNNTNDVSVILSGTTVLLDDI